MKGYNFRLIYSKPSKKSFIIKTLFLSLFVGFVVSLVAGYFLGFRAFTVLGWSSEPYIHYGSVAIDYKVPLEEIKVGDFVTWSRSGNMNVTHQVIDVDYENQLITTSQTDHYLEPGEIPNPDAPVTYSQIKGKVLFSIPKLGQIIYDIKGLIVTGNRLNLLGIMFITLTFTFYYLFKKLLYVETYHLKGENTNENKNRK